MTTREENWPEIVEAFHQRGVRAARANYPRLTIAQWISEGLNPDVHKFYVMGYNETFDAMTSDERRKAALS